MKTTQTQSPPQITGLRLGQPGQSIAEKARTFIIIVMFLALVALAIMGYVYLKEAGTIYGVQTTRVQQVFVDLNGDGQLDLIVRGEVIINGGGVSSPGVPLETSP